MSTELMQSSTNLGATRFRRARREPAGWRKSAPRARQLALLALTLGLLACARPPAAAPAPQTPSAPAQLQPAAPPGLFLYRVERDGHASHLLGTIHLGFGFDEVLSADAKRAFHNSRAVVTETDLGQDPAGRLVQAALLPQDQQLSQLLGEPAWSGLVERLGQQLPPPLLMRMKPWLPAVLLGLTELRQAFDEAKPGASERMMDIELMARAREREMTLLHLETVDDQIAVFEQISLEEQLSELRHALTEDSRGQARALVDAFASGNEEQLVRALFDAEQMKSAPGFYQTVLFARNERWLPTLEPLLAQGDTFVAVGAAHLFGEQGLLRAFRARGYAVTRVY
jgi:uncharacterized protein YbaP (TraB family)